MFAIEISKLSKTYKNGYRALEEINLKVNQGEFLALLGRNGAGKTTLVAILSSLVKKTTGEVRVNGTNIDSKNELTRLKVGFVSQEINLSIFEKVVQVLITQAGYFGIDVNIATIRAKKYLQLLELWHKRNNAVITLSGGMKRRLMIARALMHEPDIIFFDEPTAGVDVEVKEKIWGIMKNLNKLGKTIILTTHCFHEAEKLCNSIAIIARGRIILHSLLQTITENYVKQKYLVEIKNKENFFIQDRSITRISDSLLEISVDHENSLLKNIKSIVKHRCIIVNIQPKNNRLEQLFLNLTK